MKALLAVFVQLVFVIGGLPPAGAATDIGFLPDADLIDQSQDPFLFGLVGDALPDGQYITNNTRNYGLLALAIKIEAPIAGSVSTFYPWLDGKVQTSLWQHRVLPAAAWADQEIYDAAPDTEFTAYTDFFGAFTALFGAADDFHLIEDLGYYGTGKGQMTDFPVLSGFGEADQVTLVGAARRSDGAVVAFQYPQAPQAVPVPGAVLMMLTGFAALAMASRRFRFG